MLSLRKHPLSSQAVSFDFGNFIPGDRSITSVSSTSIEDASGYEADDPITIPANGAAYEGKVVTVLLRGGSIGRTYRLTACINTDDNQVLCMSRYIQVEEVYQ